ncbi:MAG: hypothetical protein JSS81_20150 [Acidobacteria bacterium]|nr:hypothetical protein [Acidobacteriota bacterium]
MRQEVSEFQKQFEAEFEKHKAQLDEVFQNLSARVNADRTLDASFTESVVEHLRLSRDEGARITAMAIAEAEELEKQNVIEPVIETVATPPNYGEIRDAINEISSKTTQSAILKTLVHHAGQFTPRGAFFIIKNEHLVGWRVFGKDGATADEHTVREVFFPVAASTVLGEAIRSLAAVESTYGTYSDDSIYLNKLDFGQPDHMYAVPLVVRGRSVAVLYADCGTDGGHVNVDAIETLVRVASLTVEILASSRGAQTHPDGAADEAHHFEEPVKQEVAESPATVEAPVAEPAPAVAESYHFAEPAPAVEETPAEPEPTPEESFAYTAPVEESYSYQPIAQPTEAFEEPAYQEPIESDSFSFKPSVKPEAEPAPVETESHQPVFETTPSWNQTVETEDYSPASYEAPSYEISQPPSFEAEKPAEPEYAPAATSEYQFETTQSYEPAPVHYEEPAPVQTFETPAYEAPAYEAPSYETESYAPANGAAYEPAVAENGKAESYSAPVEAPVEAPAETVVKQPAKSRFSDRNVDLPIEVSEDERRLHNDARRFARLLVSEIKLYNEQKVKEGREASDLYERLREAIDRSREMYDKRVQPPVAAKFDYFHYELVSNLAEGDAGKLGASYPGANN